MNQRILIHFIGAGCLALALAGCDRRDTHPPDESRAADTDVQPAGTAGAATRPADSGNPDGRCGQLAGDELRDCMAREEAARETGTLRP